MVPVAVLVCVLAACEPSGDQASGSTSNASPSRPAAQATTSTGDVFTSGDRTTDTVTDAATATSPPPTTVLEATTSTTSTTATTDIAPATTPLLEPTAPATTLVEARPFSSPCPPTGSRIWEVRPASDIAPSAVPEGWRIESAGSSVQGRDLTVMVRPVEAAARTVLVIGGIHGNEPVSPPTVRAMADVDIPDDTEVWLLPLLNPDGSAIGTRCNANGVDLNRNFSWAWRSDTGGPGPFSEPEPAAAAALVERLDPDLVVWVHQPLGYIGSIGDTPDEYEQVWAAASGSPVRSGVSQQGGGESWTAFVAGVPSMLIEVDTYDARPDMVDAHVAGFADLLGVVVPR